MPAFEVETTSTTYQHLQDVISRITINVYRMSGQPTLQMFPSFYELERNRHSHLKLYEKSATPLYLRESCHGTASI